MKATSWKLIEEKLKEVCTEEEAEEAISYLRRIAVKEIEIDSITVEDAPGSHTRITLGGNDRDGYPYLLGVDLQESDVLHFAKVFVDRLSSIAPTESETPTSEYPVTKPNSHKSN